jgi:hypothetical protein
VSILRSICSGIFISCQGTFSKISKWLDRWLQGYSMADLAPSLVKMVPKRISKIIKVMDALPNNSWVNDMH